MREGAPGLIPSPRHSARAPADQTLASRGQPPGCRPQQGKGVGLRAKAQPQHNWGLEDQVPAVPAPRPPRRGPAPKAGDGAGRRKLRDPPLYTWRREWEAAARATSTLLRSTYVLVGEACTSGRHGPDPQPPDTGCRRGRAQAPNTVAVSICAHLKLHAAWPATPLWGRTHKHRRVLGCGHLTGYLWRGSHQRQSSKS